MSGVSRWNNTSESDSQQGGNQYQYQYQHLHQQREASEENFPFNFSDQETALELLQQLSNQHQSNDNKILLEQLNRMVSSSQAAAMHRPTEQYITIAQNGTILGATETVTGFTSDSLLMTSMFEGVYHNDVMSLKAIKQFFWEKGMLQTKVFFRRVTVEGDLIWLEGSVAGTIDIPVPGFTIKESRVRVQDEEKAANMNKLTRITTLLAKAVEDAYSHNRKDEDPNSRQNALSNTMDNFADDAKVLRSLLAKETTALSEQNPNFKEDSVMLQALLQKEIESNKGRPHTKNRNKSFNRDSDGHSSDGSNSESGSNFEDMEGNASIQDTTIGPSTDLSKIKLNRYEVKLISMVFTGEISVDQLAHMIFDSTNSLTDAKTILLSCNVPLSKSIETPPSTSRRSNVKVRHIRSNNSISSLDYTQHNTNSPSSAKSDIHNQLHAPLHIKLQPVFPPPLTTINLSYSMIGNRGISILSEAFQSIAPSLKYVDLSFCDINEKGFLAFSRALVKRRKKGLPSIQRLILTGNRISYKAAKELGLALSSKQERGRSSKSFSSAADYAKTGYDEDDEDDDDDDEDDDLMFGNAKRRHSGRKIDITSKKEKIATHSSHERISDDPGIELLHLGSTSLGAASLAQLLTGLGTSCRVREIDVSSNLFGIDGITHFAEFLEGNSKGQPVMPILSSLNISNNKIGDEGLAKITRAISKRKHLNMGDIYLSFNEIGAGGTGTLMHKLLSHNIVTLSLDNNLIGDAGCQLVAASLTSMHSLSNLNLSFNQIGSRGVTSVMRALIGCESLRFLGLSGNVMKISGAIAMGFALAQHPRLTHLELYNCCLSQVSQCHIIAGIISNRWVPVKTLNGFRAGPPMAAIGALDTTAQHLSNSECLSIRRNVQMKAILQWVEAAKKLDGPVECKIKEPDYKDYGLLDFLIPDESYNGAPSQSAFFRVLEWLSRIPFDEDELNCLRQYFYDGDDGSPDGLRGSNGKINLKYRGDLLAALGSGMVKEMNNDITVAYHDGPAMGLSLSSENIEEEHSDDDDDRNDNDPNLSDNKFSQIGRTKSGSELTQCNPLHHSFRENSAFSSQSKFSLEGSTSSMQSNHSQSSSLKSRITMFPIFCAKLDLLKANAQEMMDSEYDPARQDLIAQQFAEASLILLRQLRYHCMNTGLDGWRHGKIKRKVLIVDDSLVTRKLVGRAFEKANFIVDTAENGEVGLRMMKESVYDIAFMDIDMPVMNGFDATKALREWEDSKRPGARQPICALTATYVDDFERHELMKFKEAGLDVMESKPCNIPRLFKVVDDVSPMFSDLSISVTQNIDASSSNFAQHTA